MSDSGDVSTDDRAGEEAQILVGISFDDLFRAREFLTAGTRLAANGSLVLRDAVIVVKDENGKTMVRETTDPQPKQAALGGAMWAGLFGLLLGGPVGLLAGSALGAGAGAVTAQIVDIGISDEWVAWFRDAVQPDTATVVLLVSELDREALVAEAKRFSGARLVYANLEQSTLDRITQGLGGLRGARYVSRVRRTGRATRSDRRRSRGRAAARGSVNAPDPPANADDLATWSLDWTRQWWDAEAHLVHNSAGSFGELIPARTVHLTPQSAWVAYGLLGSADPADHAEADRAIAALLSLQYDAPGAVFHGTFARFLEAPYPPDEPTMWEDYDPNWRQFVGTAFALMLEDFSAVLSDERRAGMLASIRLACEGEEAEGRLEPSYANPALMHSWLAAWSGQTSDDDAQVQRAEEFAGRIVKRFDRYGTFDEFNSPTYYGIDLYALALWRTFPPTALFAADGARLESAIWHEAASFYHPGLANFCGPYTRSYGPDATQTVTLMALWIWAAFGRRAAPLPDLDADVIDHGHDLMAGSVVARLSSEPTDEGDRSAFSRLGEPRAVRRELPTGRVVSAALFEDLMLGAEGSEHDWRGWEQFMPAVAHWRDADGVGVLWLADPRRVWGRVDGNQLAIEVQRPGQAASAELIVSAPTCVIEGNRILSGRARIELEGDTATMRSEQTGERLHRVRIEPVGIDVAVLRCVLSFAVSAAPQ